MELLRLREHETLIGQAAAWFHSKWGVPAEAYRKSMQESLQNQTAVPQWYVMRDGDAIIGGAGIIENDFHDRKDLSPNVCALYVEDSCRRRGIAGRLLEYACRDMARAGIPTLYLVTEHTSFYERYGWRFLCMVREEDGPGMLRMYVRGTASSSVTPPDL